VGLIVAAAGIAVLLVRRWLASSGAQRRIIAPVLWTGAALVAAVSLLVLLQVTGAPTAAQNAVTVVSAATIAAVPFAFLAGLLRMRTTRADIVGGLVGNLESAGSSIRETIATALGDPSLELIYWRAEKAEYVTADGGPARLPTGDPSRAVAEIERDGRPIAAMVFDATLADEPELIAAVSSAGALALDNERLQAELRARIAELEESRARVLDAELAERRRIERDLHDGAQQRFVSLSMTLALLDRGLAGAGAERQLLASAREQLDLGLGELHCSRKRGTKSRVRPATRTSSCARSARTNLSSRSSMCGCRRRSPTRGSERRSRSASAGPRSPYWCSQSTSRRRTRSNCSPTAPMASATCSSSGCPIWVSSPTRSIALPAVARRSIQRS
jgi:signal transduction histidine kinase